MLYIAIVLTNQTGGFIGEENAQFEAETYS